MSKAEEKRLLPQEEKARESMTDQILSEIKKCKISLYSMIKEAGNLFSLADDTLTIGFSSTSKAYKEHVEKKENIQLIHQSIEKILGKNLKVRIAFHTPESADVEEMISKPKEEFEQERLVKRAMEEPVIRAFMDTFHSEIIHVEKL